MHRYDRQDLNILGLGFDESFRVSVLAESVLTDNGKQSAKEGAFKLINGFRTDVDVKVCNKLKEIKATFVSLESNGGLKRMALNLVQNNDSIQSMVRDYSKANGYDEVTKQTYSAIIIVLSDLIKDFLIEFFEGYPTSPYDNIKAEFKVDYDENEDSIFPIISLFNKIGNSKVIETSLTNVYGSVDLETLTFSSNVIVHYIPETKAYIIRAKDYLEMYKSSDYVHYLDQEVSTRKFITRVADDVLDRLGRV